MSDKKKMPDQENKNVTISASLEFEDARDFRILAAAMDMKTGAVVKKMIHGFMDDNRNKIDKIKDFHNNLNI